MLRGAPPSRAALQSSQLGRVMSSQLLSLGLDWTCPRSKQWCKPNDTDFEWGHMVQVSRFTLLRHACRPMQTDESKENCHLSDSAIVLHMTRGHAISCKLDVTTVHTRPGQTQRTARTNPSSMQTLTRDLSATPQRQMASRPNAAMALQPWPCSTPEHVNPLHRTIYPHNNRRR